MSISKQAQILFQQLAARELKIVFAESCTAGLVAASLAEIPGVSQYLCGGVVTYRNETKAAYLQIPDDILLDPGPVSREVARLMAVNVLAITPEADIAASVTGHLGPDAPDGQDGLVFIGVAVRHAADAASPETLVEEIRCKADTSRLERRRRIVEQTLALVSKTISRDES